MADFFLVVSAAFAKSKVYMTPFKERKKIAFDILKRWRGEILSMLLSKI